MFWILSPMEYWRLNCLYVCVYVRWNTHMYVFKCTYRAMFVLHVVDVLFSLSEAFLALYAPPLHTSAFWRAHLIFLLILLIFSLVSLFPFMLSLLLVPLLILLSLSLAQLIGIVFCGFRFRGGVAGRSRDRRGGGGRNLNFDGQASMSSLMGNITRQLWLKAWAWLKGKCYSSHWSGFCSLVWA